MRALLGALCAIAFTAPLEAQRPAGRFDPPAAADTPRLAPDVGGPRSEMRLAAGGVMGGLTAGVAGGMALAALSCRGEPADSYCGFMFIPGFALAETIGVAVGVHLANDRQGSGFAVAAASLGALLAGIGAVALVGEEYGWIVIPFIPIVQIGAAVSAERSTTPD